MPVYQLFHLKESRRQAFRESPPQEPPYRLKPAYYEPGAEIEAPSPYAAWKELQEQPDAEREVRPLSVGDALERGRAELLVCNFWGFDRAVWHEPKPHDEPGVAAEGPAELESSAQPSDEGA